MGERCTRHLRRGLLQPHAAGIPQYQAACRLLAARTDSRAATMCGPWQRAAQVVAGLQERRGEAVIATLSHRKLISVLSD